MEAIGINEILSEREYEIMEMVAKGKSNKEIADQINRDETTVKKHLQHIFLKLGVRNRTAATIRFLLLSGSLVPDN